MHSLHIITTATVAQSSANDIGDTAGVTQTAFASVYVRRSHTITATSIKQIKGG